MSRIIKGKVYYRPMEVAKLGLITSNSSSPTVAGNYDRILRLIKAGQLKAVDYGLVGGRPYYLISTTEIERFHDNHKPMTIKPRRKRRGTRQDKTSKQKV